MLFLYCTVHTWHGSKLRTMCCTASACASSATVPSRAASSGPGWPSLSRGEKFQVVGAMIC